MIIKGNGFYGDIEIKNEKEAISQILRSLNHYQIGWDVVYVNELLEKFNLNKNDFKFYDVNFHHGIYGVIYLPYYSEEELKNIELKFKNQYTNSLLREIIDDIGFITDSGYDIAKLEDFLPLEKLQELANHVYKIKRSINYGEQELFATKENL